MSEPIKLIEKDLKYKKGTLESLEKRLHSEEIQMLTTREEVKILKKEIAIFEEAIALLKGK